MSPDMINALFEFGGSLVLARNCWTLCKDKVVKGWHWHSVAFFGMWGLWNLFYYPHLDQWWSFLAGLLLVGVNLTWLCQVWYYAQWRKS